MDLHHLKAFIAVAESGNVTRAAERLFTSQPAVSNQIKALEQEFGVDLFLRTGSGMTLTEDGQHLLGHAKQLLAQSRSLEDLARHLRDGTAGTLRVGVNNSAKMLRIDEMSRRLMAAHPQLQLDFQQGASGIVAKGVKSYDLDVGFIEGFNDDPALELLQLSHVDLVVIYPAAWHCDLKDASWQEIQNYPWIFVSPECSYYRLFEQISKEHGLKFQQQFRVDQEGTAVHFVSTGTAVSLADRNLVQDLIDAGDVAVWPHFEHELPLSVCALKKRMGEKPIAAFWEAASQTFAAGAVDRV